MQAREVRDGDSIGCIVRFRDTIEMEYDFKSVLHLLFFGGTIPADPSLDLEWGKFADRYSFLLECQEDSSACLGDIDTGFLIGGKKEFLDTADRRMVGINDLSEVVGDIHELEGDIHLRRSGDDSIVENIHRSAIFLDHSKADGRGPGIDP